MWLECVTQLWVCRRVCLRGWMGMILGEHVHVCERRWVYMWVWTCEGACVCVCARNSICSRLARWLMTCTVIRDPGSFPLTAFPPHCSAPFLSKVIASDLSLPLGKGGPNLLSVRGMTLQWSPHYLYPHSTGQDVARWPHVATRGPGRWFLAEGLEEESQNGSWWTLALQLQVTQGNTAQPRMGTTQKAPETEEHSCSCLLTEQGVWVVVVQSLVTSNSLWAQGLQHARLPFTISWSLLKLMSTESVMPSNHLILCCPLLLLPSIFPSIRVFSMCWLFTNQVAQVLELQL